MKKEKLNLSQKELMANAKAVIKCGDIEKFYDDAKEKNETVYQSLVDVGGKLQLLTLMRDENSSPENFHGALVDPVEHEVLMYVCSSRVAEGEGSEPSRETYYFNNMHECVQESEGPSWLKSVTGRVCEVTDPEKVQDMNMLMTVIEADCENNKEFVFGENLDLSMDK